MSRSTDAVKAEFATVDAVLRLDATTSRVDAFVLTWIKVEKQLRRLFCYLVFQSPHLSIVDRDEWLKVIIENRDLCVSSLIKCFDTLSPTSLRAIVGAEYRTFIGHIARIRGYRNKILHGQVTGQNRTRRQLESDIRVLRQWIETVAQGCDQTIGYDGVGRNTFRRAKTHATPAVVTYPFTTAVGFKKWLGRVAGR
jgi:hypothetical protein